MSYSPEQLKKAFVTVLNERVPDLSKIPDHVFSERFEKKMKKLIAREAAHPWAVSHTAVKNLIIAAIVIILMIVMCLSVSGIREAIFNFFIKHFDTYNEIVFDENEKSRIDQTYSITKLPSEFELKQKIENDSQVVLHYENAAHEWIIFEQLISNGSNSRIIDNERTNGDYMETDNTNLYYAVNQNVISLAWRQDCYEFWLSISISDFSLEDALELYRSVEPINQR